MADGATKKVLVVSDSIGETADRMVGAAMTQFNLDSVEVKRYPHVNSKEKVKRLAEEAAQSSSLIAYTIVLEPLRDYLIELTKEKQIEAVDLLQPLLDSMGRAFGAEPKKEPGRMHELNEDYFRRIEAVEFAVKYDDAQDTSGIPKADLVLIGVSRTSKTPLSMYLAHKQFKVANVPLVPEVPPPDELFTISRDKCIGLIISPDKLHDIRKTRLKAMGLREEADYASMDRILEEIEYAENVMKRIGCPVINVSEKAVEETASYILEVLKVERSVQQ